MVAAHSVGMSCPASHRLTGLGTVCDRKGSWKCLSHNRELKCLEDFRGLLRQTKVIINYVLKERVLKKHFHLLVVSEYLRRVFLNQGWSADRTHVVPNSVGLVEEKGNPDPSPVILFSGRFTKLKGISLMMDSLSRIKQLPWTLVVVGGEKDRASDALVERYGLTGRIRFEGWVPATEVRKWYERATLVLQTNLAPEGFGLSVAEAAACGRPVVITDVPALNEIVLKNKTGLVVFPEPQKIADAVRSLLESPELCQRLGHAGRAHVRQKYNEDVHLRALTEAYRAVLQIREEKLKNAS
jgi:glycosyltransferase involved in cell wall biosynthesis